jgi:hypothetical protein
MTDETGKVSTVTLNPSPGAVTQAGTPLNSGTLGNLAQKDDYVKAPGYGPAINSGSDYLVTLNPAPTAYIDGMGVCFKVPADNTGASTVNVNSLGAKAIKRPNGKDAYAGLLKAGSIVTLRYNATTGNFTLQGEGGAGLGDYLTNTQLGLPEFAPVYVTGADRDIYRAVTVPSDLDHVYVCDANGTFVAKVNIHTMQYEWQIMLTATDICTDGNYIYVVGGKYLTKFDLNGNQIWQITGPMTSSYNFTRLDYSPSDGLLHTCDSHEDYRRYDRNGNMVGTALSFDTTYSISYIRCNKITHQVYIMLHNSASIYSFRIIVDGAVVNSLSLYAYPEPVLPLDNGNFLRATTSGISLYDKDANLISSVNTTAGQSSPSRAFVDIADGTIYYGYQKSTDNLFHLCKINSAVTTLEKDYEYTSIAPTSDKIVKFVHDGVIMMDGLHSFKLKFKILLIV